MLQQENLADKELVVGSIKVLGSMSGGGTEKVRENIEMLQNTVKTQAAKTENYWESLTKDGIISPIEKKQLKKEYEGIDQTHTVLLQQAEAKGIDMSKEVIEYDTAFEELKNYLFVQLQLFQKMTEPTTIESAEVFNSYYNTYFNKLQNAQARVTIGEPGKIRVISSLLEPGIDGEVVLYENNFYMYDMENHEWIGISVASKVGEYAGVRTDSPPQLLNMFFLVGPGGITEDFIEFTTEVRSSEDNAWTDENGNIIFINYGFEEGYIYYWIERNEFEKVEDRNNWRYIVAMNDMIACGFEVSPQLYEWLTGELAENIGEGITEKTLEKIPKYERVHDVPQNPNNGDFILWDAPSTARFTKGHLYIYQKATVEWIELDPLDESGSVRSKFMTALTDILEVMPTETGYFSTVFAGAFFANTATMNSLTSREIEIQKDGYIKSSGYIDGQRGFILNGNGSAKFNDVTIFGYATDNELKIQKERIDDADAAIQVAQKDVDDAKAGLEQAQEQLDIVLDSYVAKVDVEYQLGDSETEAPTGHWSTKAPIYIAGKFMWQRTAITKGTGIVYSDPTCISGAKGNSVSLFREQYYSSTSETEVTGGEWVYSQPRLEKGHYLWTRTEMTWQDNTITYSDAILAAAIEQVYTDVSDAQKKVDTANNTLSQVTQVYDEKVFIKAGIIKDGQEGWALVTGENFDPDKDASGFGVKRNGDVYGNNCHFKNGFFQGAIESTNFSLSSMQGYSFHTLSEGGAYAYIKGISALNIQAWNGKYINMGTMRNSGILTDLNRIVCTDYMHGYETRQSVRDMFNLVESYEDLYGANYFSTKGKITYSFTTGGYTSYEVHDIDHCNFLTSGGYKYLVFWNFATTDDGFVCALRKDTSYIYDDRGYSIAKNFYKISFRTN